MTINVKLNSHWNKSDFAMLSFQFYSRTSVIVPNRIVGVAEDTDGVAARENVIEVAKTGKIVL